MLNDARMEPCRIFHGPLIRERSMMETPFRRVFPPKDLLRGSARWAWVLSAVVAAAIGGLLFGIYLLVDLLVTRGEVVLPTNVIAGNPANVGVSMPSRGLQTR